MSKRESSASRYTSSRQSSSRQRSSGKSSSGKSSSGDRSARARTTTAVNSSARSSANKSVGVNKSVGAKRFGKFASVKANASGKSTGVKSPGKATGAKGTGNGAGAKRFGKSTSPKKGSVNPKKGSATKAKSFTPAARGKQSRNEALGIRTNRSTRSFADSFEPVADRALGGDQIEGRQAVRELLRARKRRVIEILISEDLERASILADIVDLAEKSNVTLREIGANRLHKLARTESHQGVVARAAPLREYTIPDLVKFAADQGVKPFFVVLDSVTDPHNLGAILRSALCAGATGAILPRHRSALISPTAAKASAGAIEHIPIAVVAGVPSAIAELKKLEIWTVGLAGEANDSLFDEAFARIATDSIALIVGAEGEGLSDLVQKRCDLLVSIPQSAQIDSLNASAAAAVGTFEVLRNRR